MSETYGFTELTQLKIVSLLIFDIETFLVSREMIKPEFFDNIIVTAMVKTIYKFFDSYNRPPTPEEFLNEFISVAESKKYVKKEWAELYLEILNIKPVVEDFNYIKDKIKDFARYQAVKAAIIDSADVLQKNKDYEKIMSLVEKSMQIGELTESLGSFYYRETEERLKARRDGDTRRATTIPTGIDILDNCLGGGIGLGELGILMCPMKRGKTQTAVNFAKGALYGKKNVLFIGFEGSETRTQVLFDSCISSIEKDHLKDFEEEVRDAVDIFFNQATGIGKLVVKHFPPLGCSAATIQTLMQKLKIMEHFEPDLLIIDYLSLMRSSDSSLRVEASSGGRYHLLGAITKELLALTQKNKLSTWLLHQTTRSSKSKKTVDLDDSGDSIEPMRDADLILTLNQTAEEADPEINPGVQDIRIFIAGGREVRDRKTIHLKIDKAKVQIWSEEITLKSDGGDYL